MNQFFSFSRRLIFSATLVLLSCSASFGDDVIWTGSFDNAWETRFNWSSNTVPVATDSIIMIAGTANFTSSAYASSGGVSPGFREIEQSGGTLNITGGELHVAQVAGAISNFDGTVNQSGGLTIINVARLGTAANATGSYTLSGGEVSFARARSGLSLSLGTGNSSVGNMTVSGGSLVTRAGVSLGDDSNSIGNFTVLGSQASTIAIGGANDDGDGVWHQYPGSSLVVRTDFGGCTPIILRDNAGDGTSATFENGTILDVDHLSGDAGGTWTVMEVQNGDITDNGLAFAPSVDTSIWSFEIDNSGANGKLTVTATGELAGFPLVVGNTLQQNMRFGMDYERLWFWTGGLNASERDEIAKWSAIDTRIDYIRVAMNSGYELEEGQFNLSAYTNKIIPMMQEMKDANPDIKFFASPRPLNEAVSGAAWQPYPRWVTGDPGNGNFDFDWQKCAEYVERYLLLMDSYGFKISFMDLTNEWQSNVGGGRITQADFRDIVLALRNSTALANANIEAPKFIGPSAWNYSQGASWIDNLTSQLRRDAVDIAACHNTDRTGSAQQFADSVRDRFSGPNDTMPEIWNTEVHGWKSTSNENETTSFYYMLEKIRAGFSGLNGWLAIGTTNQGHAYILNPNGTPRRNVKYFIFKKLSATSNYGHALNIIQEPSQLSHTAALIRGNLMTVWVINQGSASVPINITPAGRTISESSIKRTRWTDPDDVEGFVTFESASGDSLFSSIPGESVCCFEVLLDPEEFPYTIVQAETVDQLNDLNFELSGDDDGTLNLSRIKDTSWARFNSIDLIESEAMRFRVARPSGRQDGWVEVYLGAPGASTASILAGTPVGKVAVPETGGWQIYETIEAAIEANEGTYDVVLNFDEVGDDSNTDLFNLNWLAVVSPASETLLGDCNQDGIVNFLDIAPFISFLSTSDYLAEGDMNEDGSVNFLDIAPFIAALSS